MQDSSQHPLTVSVFVNANLQHIGHFHFFQVTASTFMIDQVNSAFFQPSLFPIHRPSMAKSYKGASRIKSRHVTQSTLISFAMDFSGNNNDSNHSFSPKIPYLFGTIEQIVCEGNRCEWLSFRLDRITNELPNDSNGYRDEMRPLDARKKAQTLAQFQIGVRAFNESPKGLEQFVNYSPTII